MLKAKLAYGWLLACSLLIGAPAQAGAPIVAAASDLQFALTEAAEQFEQQTGHALRLNFGSSGNFRRQIEQGAPFELYLSADERYVQALYEEGHTQDEGVIYAIGRLVWLQRSGRDDLPSGDAPLAAVQDALTAHASGTTERIALANPEHAPYGVAAQQALEHAGLWEPTEPLRVLGENVSQAAQFALSDDARGGLVAYSLALAPALSERSEYVLIPEGWHSPLRQRMVLTNQAGDIASDFYQWLQEDEGQAILRRYGFSAE
ncbi:MULTISPECIES: molybdate ABC transporter substrate-binding protein [unclassified Halomonas]|uniref:molybdate ABC transporter substrate-binding protein n=1 Tax=unclassified Halomonas TaxID=2609666 RepID=UPI0007DA1258|nr:MULTISPECIES: molybdate ABC transporter substrate-binding protein [unclassified Halomonas]MBT2784992.1 molybdate ABC transporter substrate-binding protein [Halomonas sp. ISL-106]MBT2796686.1 molybdate ABC transporter substrate-binding protein [Halomonas sp. ISL-104]OAL59917.1 molybdate ABC transporter substrate-binding protein [Halomonas sp. ALS9]